MLGVLQREIESDAAENVLFVRRELGPDDFAEVLLDARWSPSLPVDERLPIVEPGPTLRTGMRGEEHQRDWQQLREGAHRYATLWSGGMS